LDEAGGKFELCGELAHTIYSSRFGERDDLRNFRSCLSSPQRRSCGVLLHTRLLARMPQHLPRIRYMLGELVGRVTSVANNKTVRQQTQHCIA
jgi:hypothetical protein